MRISFINSITIINFFKKIRSNYYLKNWMERRKNKKKLLEARKDRILPSGTNNPPLVSVLIPTYNRAKILTEITLTSVLEQTYDNIEVIIVGDECTDNTEDLVTSIGDKRIKFYNLTREEKGTYPENPNDRWMVAGADAGNKTIELSRGEWLAPCDDDDLFSKDHIKTLLDFLLDNDLEFAYGIVEMEVKEGIWKKRGRFPPECGHICRNSVMYHSSLKFIRSDLNAWKYGEPGDWNLWRRMKEAGVRMGFIEKVVGKHFIEHQRDLSKIV